MSNEAISEVNHDSMLQTSAMTSGPELIPIEELIESEWNPRQHYPDGPMSELVESMRTSGFREWLPLVVRPLPEDRWRMPGLPRAFEIGAGHRRRRAAERAGIKLIPCVVRQMTDEEFLEVLNFDNSGREDVHPLHEASGWRAWMEKTGKGVKDIAARIGQSIEYVYQRLKYAALIEEARAAFLDTRITAGHAIEIARIQADDQKKALRACGAPDWDQAALPSVRALREMIRAQFSKALSAAPFDCGDLRLLAGAGSCTECPKREEDSCMDIRCYQQKIDNHLVRIVDELRSGLPKGAAVLQVSTEYSTRKKGVKNRAEWREADPGDKGAQTAVIVEGAGLGKVVKVRGTTGTSTPDTSTPVPRPEPAPVERASSERMSERPADVAVSREKRQEKVERELEVRRAILAAVKAKLGGLRREEIEALLVHHFEGFDVECETVCALHGIDYEYAVAGASQAMAAAMPKMKEPELFAVVLEATIAEELGEHHVDQEPRGLLALAKRYRIDAAKIRLQVESGAKEAEGGTRREVPKKKASAVPKAKKASVKKAKGKPAAPPKSAPSKKRVTK